MKDTESVLFEHCIEVINTSTLSVNSINIFLLLSNDVRAIFYRQVRYQLGSAVGKCEYSRQLWGVHGK